MISRTCEKPKRSLSFRKQGERGFWREKNSRTAPVCHSYRNSAQSSKIGSPSLSRHPRAGPKRLLSTPSLAPRRESAPRLGFAPTPPSPSFPGSEATGSASRRRSSGRVLSARGRRCRGRGCARRFRRARRGHRRPWDRRRRATRRPRCVGARPSPITASPPAMRTLGPAAPRSVFCARPSISATSSPTPPRGR